MTTGVMTLRDFCDFLAARLERAPGSLDADADIRRELELDSLQMFFLLIALEDLGTSIPEALFPHILTLRDAYAQYENSLAHRN